jgi:preprotein translocase subunit SecA
VYKEKAYGKFQDLISELEYKVIKAIFSVKTISEVESVQVDQKELKENGKVNSAGRESDLGQAELEKLLDNFSQEAKKAEKPKNNKVNPLFAQPQNAPKTAQKKVEKKRIRV